MDPVATEAASTGSSIGWKKIRPAWRRLSLPGYARAWPHAMRGQAVRHHASAVSGKLGIHFSASPNEPP
ncbi:hypothetical protein [Xanthomonas translucens]|uniref:hypothetical protein n=1 Tax=Xanthomonas campestris pv. translucens TaxID=343 RepID=UPI001E5AB529|nr:hypothetical protein [Xanthomonas translucens]